MEIFHLPPMANEIEPRDGEADAKGEKILQDNFQDLF